MSDQWIVALDVGTSSCRALAIDGEGQIRARQQVVFSPKRTQEGYSEYDAHELLGAQERALMQLLDEITPACAAALAVCSQRSSIVLWEAQTGRPLAPVLTWEDGRATAQIQQVSLSQEEIHRRTGLYKTPYFSAPKIAWCLENCPQAAQAAKQGTLRVGPVASYLIDRFTQGKIFATDATLAQRTLLWDMQTGQWSESLCRVFGVPVEALPVLQPTVADYGHYLYKGVSIPIIVCSADQQAALAWQRLEAGQSFVNYGTGAFFFHHTGPKAAVLPGMLTSVAVQTQAQPFQFLLEGPVFAASSVLQWLQAQGLLQDPQQVDRVCAQAHEPVRFLPAFGGLGAPYWDYGVSASVENLSARTRAADFVAGAVQGVAQRVADIAEYLRVNQYPVQALEAGGGLSQSNYLLQTQADLLQVPVMVQNHAQSTVLGAALLAAQQLGWDVQGWMQTPTKTFVPQLSTLQAHQERGAWQAWLARLRRR